MAREHEDKGKEASGSENREDIDEYAERLCGSYEKGRYLDEALFFRIQEDFEEWSDTEIATIRRSTLRSIVDTARLCSVYIPSTRDIKQEFIRLVRSEES